MRTSRLSRILLLSKIVFVLAAAALLVQITLSARRIEAKTVDSLERTTRSVELLRQYTHRLILETSLTAKEARLASKEQRVYLQQISQGTVAAVRKATDVLAEAEQTISALRITTQQMGGDVHQVTEATANALNGLPPLLEQANKTLQASERAIAATESVIAHPSIPKTLDNVEKTSASTAKVAENLDVVSTRMAEHKPGVVDRFLSWLFGI